MKRKRPFELTFTVTGDENGGQEGRFNRAWDLEERYSEMADAVDRDDVDPELALREVSRLPLIEGDLEHVALKGSLLWTLERKEEAGELYQSAFDSARALIPAKYKGTIDWYVLDNRPFLRIAHGLLLWLMQIKDIPAADRLARMIGRWSPNGGMNVEELRADLDFMAGRYPAALKKYLRGESPDPPSLYQAGRIAFRSGNFVKACTYLRRAILHNPYIAEGIAGRTHLADHLHRTGNNMHDVEWALPYLNGPVGEWEQGEADFLDWVFNSSTVLKERARIAEDRERLMELDIGIQRSRVVDAHFGFLRNLDDSVSKSMVRQIHPFATDLSCWPWERGKVLDRTRGRGTAWRASA